MEKNSATIDSEAPEDSLKFDRLFDPYPTVIRDCFSKEKSAEQAKNAIDFEDQPCASYKFFDNFPKKFGRRFILTMAAIGTDRKIKKNSSEVVWTNRNTRAMNNPKDCLSRNAGQIDMEFEPVDAEATTVLTEEQGAGRLVPDLVGEVVGSSSFDQLLEGFGFTYKITRYEKDPSKPSGAVISQNPAGWSEVPKAGIIQIVVVSPSEGDPSQSGRSCDGKPSGKSTSRIRYKSATVAFGLSCDAVKETQIGTCYRGKLTFTGVAQFEKCEVLPEVSKCEEKAVIHCKVGRLQHKDCALPKNVISIRKDQNYKGSKCQEAPEKKRFWNSLKRTNSYSTDGHDLKVRYGCDAKFEVTIKIECKK